MNVDKRRAGLDERTRLRRALCRGSSQQRAAAFDRLLRLGGITLCNDEELLAHVDFRLAIDPLGGEWPRVVLRRIAEEPAEREALLVRGRRGRIRDRARAARLIGEMDRLDETLDDVLHGLLRDPIRVVWQAAARAVWRHAASSPALLAWASGAISSGDAETSAATVIRRHLAGGLAGALSDGSRDVPQIEEDVVAALVAAALEHKDEWTRSAAMIALGESCPRTPPGSPLRRLLDRHLEEPSADLTSSLALGLVTGGRAEAVRDEARVLADRMMASLPGCRTETAEQRFSFVRARLVLDGLCRPASPDAASRTSPAACFEAVLQAAAGADPGEGMALLGAALGSAQAAVAGIDAYLGSSPRGGAAAGAAALFHEAARYVVAEDLLGPLLDVIPSTGEERRLLRYRIRPTEHTLLTLAGRMAGSDRFLVQREGLRTLTVAMDAHVGRLRDHANVMLDKVGSSRARRPAAGALARLVERLRGDDADGFLDVVLRLFLQRLPAKTRQPAALLRVAWLVPDTELRSYLSFVARTVEELLGRPGAMRAATIIDSVLQAAHRLAETAPQPSLHTPNPAVEGLAEIARAFRYLAGDREGGSLEALAPAIETLWRCERNLGWDEPPAGDEETVRAVQVAVDRAGRLGSPAAPERLVELADALQAAGFASPLARTLTEELRRAAKRVESRARRRTRPPREGSLADVRRGSSVHGYRVLDVLARTNCSTVCTGMHENTRRTVILKLPSDEVWGFPEGREAFRQESCILSALPGDHVVRVEEFIDDDRIPLLVVQWLAGTPMEECLDRPRAVVLRWFLDILRGLQTIHDFGVVHRDLKPENVIVLPSQRAVVIDFGVAALADVRPDAPTVHAAAVNPANVVGTPPYMAPEQCRGEAPTTAGDVYALGVMLYRAVTGDFPFPDHHRRIWDRIRAGHPVIVPATTEELERDYPCPHCGMLKPAPLEPQVPPHLAHIVERTLDRSPARRPSIEEIRDAIEETLAAGEADSWES
jgi:serine/threonine-protein kinase